MASMIKVHCYITIYFLYPCLPNAILHKHRGLKLRRYIHYDSIAIDRSICHDGFCVSAIGLNIASRTTAILTSWYVYIKISLEPGLCNGTFIISER